MTVPTSLYRHFNAAGELLYVGCSARPLDRQLEHIKLAHWMSSVTMIKLEWYETRHLAESAEWAAIHAENPRYNIIRSPFPPHSRPDDVARLEKIHEWSRAGLSQSQMAMHLGLSRERVRQICAANDIETQHGGQKDLEKWQATKDALLAGNTIKETAKIVGFSFVYVNKIAHDLGIKWTKKHRMIDDIRACIDQGMTLAATARKLNRTPQTVWTTANKNGVRFTAKEPAGNRWRKPQQAAE